MLSSRVLSRSTLSQSASLWTVSSRTFAGPAASSKDKKKGLPELPPMKVRDSMSEYDFSCFKVYKEYKAPDAPASLQADSAYPPWIWDNQKEPSWNELIKADFGSLPELYQKKIFSIPRKLAIKQNNDLKRKA